jgi:hypothetical protein
MELVQDRGDHAISDLTATTIAPGVLMTQTTNVRMKFHKNLTASPAMTPGNLMRDWPRLSSNEGASRMTFDLALAGLVALGLLIYLTAMDYLHRSRERWRSNSCLPSI